MPATAQTPARTGAIASNEYWDSVSYLESAFHHGFMKLRLKHAEFVYHENPRLMQELDEFCDVDTMHTAKGPIILLGDSGVGKSAFLANWLARRKKMVQSWQSSYPEFIFTHVVGCSRQSCSVSNLLERVLREMKDYFELNKEVPEVEERLCWQFPKFLEAATKKGRVILVVDGLQRLRTNDGESILKWVPLSFPPNVRIIFTGTINYAPSKFAKTEESPIGDHYEKTGLSAQMIERIKLEASRRSWKLVHVTPLSEDDRKRIIKKFVYKNRAPSAPSSKSKGNVAASAGSDSDAAEGSKLGLQLFEIQQKAIVSVPMSANAHFLKVFLMSMLWAVREGFNIHVVFESWLNSNSIGQLLESILRSIETGYTPTEEAAADARQFLAETTKTSATASNLKRAGSSCASCITRDGPGSPSKRTSPLSPPSSGLMRRSSLDRSSNVSFTDGSARSPSPLARQSARNGNSNEAVIEFQSNDGYRPTSAVTRAKSIHETQEVFVGTDHKLKGLRANRLRGSGSSTDLTLEGDAKALLESARSLLESTSGGSIIGTPAGSGSSSPTPRAQTPSSLLTNSGSSPQLTAAVDGIDAPAASVALPPYLTGGKHVPPLGPLLGKALGVLYVSRHGMLVNELRFILSAMMTEARELRQQQLHDCMRYGYDSVMERGNNSGAILAFSDTEWKALLRAIKPMGVLFVQDVVVLPMCKDILRDVIWWRYIGSERVEQSYHQWLIRFFRAHPTTFRRVEELPWHLQRCYEWDALRAVLVNLSMFQLLYTVNYKRELYGYWRKLSQGPLLNYASGTESPLDPPAYVAPFDIVKEYGKSLEEWYKIARPPTKTFLPMVQLVTKFMYDFCVYFQGFLPAFQHAPFDLKRLYHDGFTFAEDLPHVHMLSSTNALAAAAAATASAASSPVRGSASQSASVLGGDSMATSMSAATALIAALDAFSTLGRSTAAANAPPVLTAAAGASSSTALVKHKPIVPNYFFYYQRWIWIQFPWLALSKEIVVRDPVVSNPKLNNGNSSSNGSFGLGSLDGWGGLTASTGSLPQSNYDAMVNTSRDSIDIGMLGNSSSNNSSDDRKALDGGVGGLNAASAASSNALGGSQARSGLFDVRFWDVKKSMFDPGSQKIKGTMSAAQLAAVLKASVKMSPSPTPTTQTLDIISPENLFHKKSAYAAVKNVLRSSARTLPTAVLNVSASAPTLQTLRPASPTSTTATAVQPPAVLDLSSTAAVKTFLTEANVAAADATAPTSPSRQGRARSPSKIDFHASMTLTFGESTGNNDSSNNNNNNNNNMIATTKDADSGMLSTDAPSASAAFGLPAHFQDYPQSEWDLKKSYNHRVVLKLQALHDSLRAETQRKKAHLESVKAKIKETAKRYESAMRDCEMAKQAAEEMAARAQKLDQMMKSIDHQEKTRRKLVRGCELFPAYDPSHYEDCKKELKLMQLTLKDLEEEKRVLVAKKAHLLNVELPTLRVAIDKNKELLHAVVEKLERARDKAAHEQASTDTLFQRRLEMIENVRSDAGKIVDEHDAGRDQSEASVAVDELSRRSGSAPRTGRSPSRGDASAASSATAIGNGDTLSLAAKIALQRCEAMCDKVQKATGFSRIESVYHKFARREELNASFDEQAKINEARLKQMKLTQSELEQQLHSLEVSNAVVSMEDPRSLEQKLRDAEVELARTEYTQTSLLTTSKEVIVGAARIVKLLGVTSCSSPLKNAIPAAKLWPPPAGYDGESRLTSEFETLGTAAIGNLLQICLDRAALMIDTIEGGRGDPDAMFSQHVVEVMARGRRRSSKLEDRAAMSGRQAKSGRRATNAVAAADRKDRSFDRGAIPLVAMPSSGFSGAPTLPYDANNAALASTKDAQARPLLAPPEAPDADADEDEDEGNAPGRELPSRESIKASSRSKLAQRACRDKSERVLYHTASASVHAHDVEVDGAN